MKPCGTFPPLNLWKSEAIERKISKFTIFKAGDGAIRCIDSLYSTTKATMYSEETIMRAIKLKVVSGGLKDHLITIFQPKLDQNIHYTKPPETSSGNFTTFNFKKQQATWSQHREGLPEAKVTQTIPRICTNDRIEFFVTSARKVAPHSNQLDLSLPQ